MSRSIHDAIGPLAALAALILCAGCDETIAPAPVAAVEVAAPARYLDVGQELQLEARVLDAVGKPLTGREIGWASSDERVATVSPGGVVRGVAVGQVTVTGTAGGRQASLALTVEQAVDSLFTFTWTNTFAQGASMRIAARPYGSGGSQIPGHSVLWSSSDTAVVAVSDSGVVRGVRPGSATVTVRAGRQSRTIPLTVQRPYALTVLGDFQPTAVDEAGQVVGYRTRSVGSGVQSEALLWQGGKLTTLGEGYAWDIADSGEVVGSAPQSTGSLVTEAVVWRGGVKSVLYSAGGIAEITSVNTRGEMAGYWRRTTECGSGGRCAGSVFVVRNGVVQELFRTTSPERVAINDLGWVAGSSLSGTDIDLHPYLFRDGVRTELPRVPGDPYTRVQDLNNAGLIVGNRGWWDNLVLYPLPAGGGANAVNNRGEVVGWTLPSATLWRGGQPVYLQFQHADPDWSVYNAIDVNERGQIVALARDTRTGRETRAVLLTPPQP